MQKRKFASPVRKLLSNTTTHIIVLLQVLEQPEHLTWLDLSFNKLTTISTDLAEFSSLKIMYLHGNMLKELGKVLQTLRCLPQLYSLTLHGNPLEEHKKYRWKTLNSLPQLRLLDFTNVTLSDKMRLKNKVKKTAPLQHNVPSYGQRQ
jgi:Leucine-rich repeat (LRR) protein